MVSVNKRTIKRGNMLKNIEFLRVIGCLAIVMIHLFNSVALHGLFSDINLYHKMYNFTSNGNKAVDLFFILSGLFFSIKIDTRKSIIEFLRKKIIRFYPVLIFVLILFFISSIFGITSFTLYDNILAVLGLNGTSLIIKNGNVGIFWYVSAMLWVFTLFLYLLKHYDKKNVNLFIFLSIFFCYSFIIHAKGGVINRQTQTFYYIFNIGMMRAIGGIGLGYFIGEWFKNRTFVIEIVWYKLLASILEIFCVVFIIRNLLFNKLQYDNQIIFIVVFVITIVLFLMKQGIISRFLESDIWSNLSKYTYSFYMTHAFIFSVLKGAVWNKHSEWVYSHPILNVFVALLMVFVVGVLTYHCIEKPFTKVLAKKSSR